MFHQVVFVWQGMSKEKDKRVYNTLWVFSLRRLTWTCVYRNDSVAPSEPRPRFAHQLVYDPVRKVRVSFRLVTFVLCLNILSNKWYMLHVYY